MDIKKLDNCSKKPPLYEKGNSIMWTDSYISEQLLKMHLDPEIDLASRSKPGIDKTMEFILKFCNNTKLNILDLGCGPGLYAERLAELGHNVTGVDFSESSVKYASNQARIKGLEINYVYKDYLTIDYKDTFDLVILIYTDFGVLLPSEREQLLARIHTALKSDGVFIFDVINMKNLEHKFQEHKTWTFETKGFWKDSPYLELINSFNYAAEKVFLQQHIIIDQADKINTYRFWTHYFDDADIVKILTNNGFTSLESYNNILPEINMWSGDNITFYKTLKIK